MYVIAKRTILFIHEGDSRAYHNAGDGPKRAPRKYHLNFSKDIQEVPDWLGEQDAFKTAMQDGTITLWEKPVEPVPIPAQLPQNKVVDLNKLTRADLQAHAKEVYNLELPETLKKEEMVAAILEEKKKKEASVTPLK